MTFRNIYFIYENTNPQYDIESLQLENDLLRENIKRRCHVSREKTKLPKSSKLALVSSGIVRRSRNYRVRGSRGVTSTYLVSLWNVVWFFWLRIDIALWAAIVASFGRKKETCWKLKIQNHFLSSYFFEQNIDKSLYDFLSIKKSVNNKQSYGGTAISQIKKMIAIARKEIKNEKY